MLRNVCKPLEKFLVALLSVKVVPVSTPFFLVVSLTAHFALSSPKVIAMMSRL